MGEDCDVFKKHNGEAWYALGGCVLCISGAEAMFADLGHFSVRALCMAPEPVYIKMKKPNAAIRDANSALELFVYFTCPLDKVSKFK
ncbi:hypothetical protein ACLB2K_029676 [Fragaria x ananassa]